MSGQARTYDESIGLPPMALKLGAGFTKTCAAAATPERLVAASTPCLAALVQPIMDDAGAPSNTKVVEIRLHGASSGIFIRPESDGIVLPVGDLYDVDLKVYVNGEGVIVTPLRDPAS